MATTETSSSGLIWMCGPPEPLSDCSGSVSFDQTSNDDSVATSEHSDSSESDLEAMHLRFDIFVEYTLYSQIIVDGYIRSRDVTHSFNLLCIIPDTVRSLIFKYYFIRKQNEVERLSFVGHLILFTSMSMQQVKKMICDRFGSKVPKPSKLMRIRHIYNKQHIDIVDELTEDTQQPLIHSVYTDDKTLGENCDRIRHMAQKMQICCQQLDSMEIFTQKHILIRCIRCYPATYIDCFGKFTIECMMEEFVEIVFERKDAIRDIKIKICEQIANDLHPNNMFVHLEKYSQFHQEFFLRQIQDAVKNGYALQSLDDEHHPFVLNQYRDCDILIFIDEREIDNVLE